MPALHASAIPFWIVPALAPGVVVASWPGGNPNDARVLRTDASQFSGLGASAATPSAPAPGAVRPSGDPGGWLRWSVGTDPGSKVTTSSDEPRGSTLVASATGARPARAGEVRSCLA